MRTFLLGAAAAITMTIGVAANSGAAQALTLVPLDGIAADVATVQYYGRGWDRGRGYRRAQRSYGPRHGRGWYPGKGMNYCRSHPYDGRCRRGR